MSSGGKKFFSVPNPYPLTIAGLFAAMGPQAINLGLSVGAGETMLIPSLTALGATNLFWIIIVSTIVETVVTAECLKYSLITGRSFFSMTRDIPPFGSFWPWFWAITSLVTFAWPFWLGGAASAMFKLSGWGTYYLWCAAALILILLVFVFSKTIYKNLSRLFLFIMVINVVTIVVIVGLIASGDDYIDVLWGYFNFGLAEPPKEISWKLIAGLYSQPGGSMMWVTFWVLEAGWGMGRYSGRVTGALRPPEQINNEVMQWDTSDENEVKKMKGWIKISNRSLIIWWSILGGVVMTFLYATAGYSYLYKKGIVASGLDVPLQIATIVGGTFGPVAFGIFLVFLFFTLYDAGFAYLDTYIGRTTADAVASTPGLKKKRSYRFYYFITIIIVILAGFYLVTVDQPFVLYLFVTTSAVLLRGIGAIQILYVNSKQLPETFRPKLIAKLILWFAFISGVVFFMMSVWDHLKTV
ncbi:MAG: Nramp family divalent metal transporter [Chitinophagaceae bacterium]|nr:Nramp family divalent metal transporter [Chitinophagaceae bacterium]